MDEGQLSRLLRGHTDLRLETLSDLARGLECRMAVVLEPLEESAIADQPIIPLKEELSAEKQGTSGIGESRKSLLSKLSEPPVKAPGPVAANQNDPNFRNWSEMPHQNWARAAFR